MWEVSPLNGAEKIKKNQELREDPNETSENFLFDFESQSVRMEKTDGEYYDLKITSDQNILSTGLQWWMSDTETDNNGSWIWGRFNILVSVKDAWTARIRIKN